MLKLLSRWAHCRLRESSSSTPIHTKFFYQIVPDYTPTVEQSKHRLLPRKQILSWKTLPFHCIKVWWMRLLESTRKGNKSWTRACYVLRWITVSRLTMRRRSFKLHNISLYHRWLNESHEDTWQRMMHRIVAGRLESFFEESLNLLGASRKSLRFCSLSVFCINLVFSFCIKR